MPTQHSDEDLRKTLGQLGYEAYARSTGGKTFDGRDMPTWSALPDKIKQAWHDAARAVSDMTLRRHARED